MFKELCPTNEVKYAKDETTGIEFRFCNGTWKLCGENLKQYVIKQERMWTNEISFSKTGSGRSVVHLKTTKGDEYESDVQWLYERLNINENKLQRISGFDILKCVNNENEHSIEKYNDMVDFQIYFIKDIDALYIFKEYSIFAYKLLISNIQTVDVKPDAIEIDTENKSTKITKEQLEKWIIEHTTKMSRNAEGKLFVSKALENIVYENCEWVVKDMSYKNVLKKYTTMSGFTALLDDKTKTLYLSPTDSNEIYTLSTVDVTNVTAFEDKINILYSGTSVSLTREDIVDMVEACEKNAN